MKLLNLAAREVLARAQQRGYAPESIEPCIVERRGDRWIVDVEHAAYPHGSNAQRQTVQQPQPPACKPGTELTKLLARFGITYTPDCQCRNMAAQMDRWGCDEAARPERMDEVLAVMRAEAAKRGLPFMDAIGRMLIRRAIANARRAS